MDWDANLAAIIKHTDANLKQQFRQFEEISGDLGSYSQYGSSGPAGPEYGAFGSATHKQPQQEASSGNFASAFLRDTMATLRSSNSGGAVGGGGGGGATPASFAQHFRERQERKRYEQHYENNRAATEDGESDQEEQHQSSRRRRSRNSATNGAGMGFQMYSSPTYDMAQMMEQVRLSLKLEVDARASIAERQLSALLQLCKATSEELDRLRVEVCAADRQLHTLDQVQAKMRQELTTQKDIGFHLQSMCGKDESWRMQAENQLLELRQMVAAIREQGNSVQMQVQEKLSRQELLVQFNAAIEPIKAQFQATLQHQAHQLAEITRSSSSSSLLLDALTQKVNRVQSDEIVALRNDLQALKIHVSRMGSFDRRVDLSFDDGDANEETDDEESSSRASRRFIMSRRAKEKEADQKRERLDQEREQKERLRDEALKKQIMSDFLPQAVLPLVKSELDRSLTTPLAELKTSVGRDVVQLRQDLQVLTRQIQENESTNQRRVDAIGMESSSQLKQLEQLLRSDLTAQLRDARDRLDQQTKDLGAQLMTLMDTRVSAIHSKHNDVVTVMEGEQKDRKAANETLQEELRKTRHALEEQLHVLNFETRTKATTMAEEWSQKLREVERKWNEVVETSARQHAQTVDATYAKTKMELDVKWERVEARTKAVEEAAAKVERTLQEAMTAMAKVNSSKEPSSTDVDSDFRPARRTSVSGPSSTSEIQTQSQLAAMDSLLQKMMLQMQLQLQQQQQQQQQAQLTMAQTAAAVVMPTSMYHGPYWSQLNPSTPSTPVAVGGSQLTQPPAATVSVVEKEQAKQAPSREEATGAHAVRVLESPATESGTTKHESENPKLQPDPKIDDIISRAVAEELASPLKAQVNHSKAAATSEIVSPPTNDSARKAEVLEPTRAETTPSPATSTALQTSAAAGVRDPTAKVQQTLASTAKGAITEAEMAKLRIEARRKQEQEARQQSAVSPQAAAAPNPSPPTLMRSSSTSSLIPSSQPPNPVGSAVFADSKASPLTRSSSTSNLLPSPAPAAPPPTTSDTGRPPPIKISESSTASSTIPNKPPAPAPQPAPMPTSTTPSPAAAPPPTPLIPRPGSAPVELTDGSASLSTPETKPPVSKPPPPPVIQTATPSLSSNIRPPPVPVASGPPSTPPPQPAVTHTLCEQCRLPVRSDLLSEHMQRQCIKRTVPCSKCQVKFPWHEVEPHQRHCQGAQPPPTTSSRSPVAVPPPSRTPPSVAASQAAPPPAISTSLVTETVAGEAAASAAAGSQLKKCRHCTADVPATELFEHELRCDQMLKQCPHCLRRQKMSELQDHIENCDCRLVPCPNDCGGKFLQRGIDKHLTTRCPKRSSAGSGSPSKATTTNNAGPATAPPQPPLSATASATTPPPAPTMQSSTAPTASDKLECKFCDEEFSSKEIDAHENNCDWKPKRCQHCNMVIISRDLMRHESSCKTSSKNCPHCNDTMPQSALPAHTSRCSKRPIKCIRCCQLFPADSIVAHSSSCKFIPSAANACGVPASTTVSSAATSSSAPVRIPPPPPYPPTPAVSTASGSRPTTPSSVPPPPSGARPPTPGQSTIAATSATAAKPVSSVPSTANSDPNVDDRLARRNLALSQLTNQAIPSPSSTTTQPNRLTGSTNAQGTSVRAPTQPQVEDEGEDDEEDEDEEDDGDEEDDDDEQLTLAQVVGEWSVENVCLWLHEDVGVPEVVPRFQQRRCNGEMLLELTESDLINDYGIKNRIHRERILSAIDAIKTSDDFSDDEEEDDDEEEEEEEEEEDDDDDGSSAMAGGRLLQTPQQRASMSRLSLSDASSPRDLLRRNSLPSPQHSPVRMAGVPPSSSSTLPSSSAMLRRINSALNVEFPPPTRSTK